METTWQRVAIGSFLCYGWALSRSCDSVQPIDRQRPDCRNTAAGMVGRSHDLLGFLRDAEATVPYEAVKQGDGTEVIEKQLKNERNKKPGIRLR